MKILIDEMDDGWDEKLQECEHERHGVGDAHRQPARADRARHAIQLEQLRRGMLRAKLAYLKKATAEAEHKVDRNMRKNAARRK